MRLSMLLVERGRGTWHAILKVTGRSMERISTEGTFYDSEVVSGPPPRRNTTSALWRTILERNRTSELDENMKARCAIDFIHRKIQMSHVEL